MVITPFTKISLTVTDYWDNCFSQKAAATISISKKASTILDFQKFEILMALIVQKVSVDLCVEFSGNQLIWVKPLLKYGDLSYSNMVAVHHLLKFKLLTAGRILKGSEHHFAKFSSNWSNHCWDMAFFYFQNGAILDFWKSKF